MPATENTCRNLKTLHRVFAAVSTLLLVATIWMLADDHFREWKQIQRTAQQIEATMVRWRERPAGRDKAAAASQQLRSTYVSWYGYLPLPGKRCLELPILDAFNSRRRIDNLWSEGLEIDYHFRKVRRFDRCTTCHQAIGRTQPGTSDEPAYPPARPAPLFATLTPPASGAEPGASPVWSGEGGEEALRRLWGLDLVDDSLLPPRGVSVAMVRPASPAAVARVSESPRGSALREARELRESLLRPQRGDAIPIADLRGLLMGDVILGAGGESLQDRDHASRLLQQAADAGRPVELAIRRGLPNPYASHPRLDLFVGSRSPHPLSMFGCSACHEGQGSATAFRWASHTPDSEQARRDWVRRRGWFDNPHWAFPMHPRRFAESGCLKCHHQVAALEAGERFPEPPAPRLLRGYQLIRALGCYGCHEINGYRDARRVGPDLRAEPSVAAAAMQLRADPGFRQLDAIRQGWVEQLIQRPDRDDLRRQVLQLLAADAAAEAPRFSPAAHRRLLPLLKDVQNPGTLRAPGPSLRFMAQKLDSSFAADWIREPRRLNPATRMPHSFGLWQHLEGNARAKAERYAPLEILGMVTYLRRYSQELLPAMPEGARVAQGTGSIARGKLLFEERGCLACHRHQDFADAEAYRAPGEIVQGPDLSGIADKLSKERGRGWLDAWLKEPARCDPRTLMPNPLLEPIPAGEPTVADPAADIAAYLLASSSRGWSPSAEALASPERLDAGQRRALDELTAEYLRGIFSEAQARDYAAHGIPSPPPTELGEAESELLVAAPREGQGELSIEQKLTYLGRKALARYGCAGCHDVPGLEHVRPIGVALADWGRKDESQLAFQDVVRYLEQSGSGSGRGAGPGAAPFRGPGADFYWRQIQAGRRAGFLFQKLREPRSYDYRRAENKRYTEWLRMPQFSLEDEDREAIITFVLGLVADPPGAGYVDQPAGRRGAIAAGLEVLDRYQCGACHVLEPETWRLRYPPGEIGPPPAVRDFPFLEPQLPPETLAASSRTDRSGLLQATLQGLPTLDGDALPMVLDEDGSPLQDGDRCDPATLQYLFDLWRPAALQGRVHAVGVRPQNVRGEFLAGRTLMRGGFLTRYLLPRVVRREKTVNPNVKGTEAWGWLPPVLAGEGEKVQPDWLHEFLLNPRTIRPASVLFMPRYNLSPAEATILVHYFAARDHTDYPYEFQDRRQPEYLEDVERRYRAAVRAAPGTARTRFTAAMGVVTNENYCIKCHVIGDVEPRQSARSKAPDLTAVYRRLRPRYLRQWIANPKSLLPYTGMPVNIPYDPDAPHEGGIRQALYPGTSVQQLDALVDLLSNYDEFARQESPVGRRAAPGTSGASRTVLPFQEAASR